MAEKSPGEIGSELDPTAGPVQSDEPHTQAQAEADTGFAPTASTAPKVTVAGRVWVAIGIAVVVLVLLIIFIAENSRKVTISFLGAHGTLSLGLTMLIAALAGVVITLLVGSTRILQLRREVRRHRRPALARHRGES